MMVTVSAVMVPVLLIFNASSVKNAVLELITVVSATPPVPLTAGFIVSEMVAVWVRLPLVPVTVMVEVPAVAVLAAVNVIVLVPVVDAGLNAAVTPAGNPLALKATLPVKPPLGVIVIVSVAVAPALTETDVEEAAMEKLGRGGAVTVSAIVVLAVSVPLVPLIVMVAEPTVAVLDAVSVTVLVLAVEAGLKAAVTPAGKPAALNDTLPVKPPCGVTVIVVLPAAP